ncbi:MAG TPA: hypothetical protein VLL51_06025 [Gemmatimonadales bacterium]|nr:hypothetical protein [Gemmatimonadales bacterium]
MRLQFRAVPFLALGLLLAAACGGAKSDAEADMAAQRAQQLAADWQVLNTDMPRNLAAIKERIDMLGAGESLPEGVTAEGLAAAKATYESAGAAWDEAVAAYNGGDAEGAMTKALNLRTQLDEAMKNLGMESGDRAWGNLMTPTPQ